MDMVHQDLKDEELYMRTSDDAPGPLGFFITSDTFFCGQIIH